MSVKALLDDAAAGAITGLRVDLTSAQQRAAQRRASARRRASVTMASAVAVAALVTLIAVLLPGATFHSAVVPTPASTGKPTGLPERWFSAPPWTPPVTRHPMSAASMVLAAPLQPGWTSRPIDGPILVSADGTSYASLPWSTWDGLVSLASSGRDVGWVSQSGGKADGPKHAVVHRVRLSDGRQRDVELPSGVRVDRLAWQDDRLFVAGVLPSTSGPTAFMLSPGSDVLAPVRTLPATLQEEVPLGDADDAIMSPFAVHDPDGARTADLVQRAADPAHPEKPLFSLRIAGRGTDRQVPIPGLDPGADVQVLGWAEGGIVMRVLRLGQPSLSLRLFSPDDNSFRIVSWNAETNAFPVAVASDVVDLGTPVSVVKPQFSSRDRSHLRYLSVRAWSEFHLGLWFSVLFGLAVLVGLALGVRRFRRTGRSE